MKYGEMAGRAIAEHVAANGPYAGRMTGYGDWKDEWVGDRHYPSPDHSIPLPRYRTVPEDMWCPKCGSVTQVHVTNDPGSAIERFCRALLPGLEDHGTVCVLAYGTGVSVVLEKNGHQMSVGTSWETFLRSPTPTQESAG